MSTILMAGRSLSVPNKCSLKEVPERDLRAYQSAGFELVEDRILYDWVQDSGFRHSGLGTRYEIAWLVPPVEGVADGENMEFTFPLPVAVVCRNGIVSNELGTIDGNVFTFDSAPNAGDEIKGLVGVQE